MTFEAWWNEKYEHNFGSMVPAMRIALKELARSAWDRAARETRKEEK